jgi:hypothetical protein
MTLEKMSYEMSKPNWVYNSSCVSIMAKSQ